MSGIGCANQVAVIAGEQLMNRIQLPLLRLGSVFCIAGMLLWLPGGFALAQNVQHLSRPYPGGLPGSPVVTGVVPGSNSLTVTWDGPSGYYQLFEKSGIRDRNWQGVGKATNLTRHASVPTAGHSGFSASRVRRPPMQAPGRAWSATPAS